MRDIYFTGHTMAFQVICILMYILFLLPFFFFYFSFLSTQFYLDIYFYYSTALK